MFCKLPYLYGQASSYLFRFKYYTPCRTSNNAYFIDRVQVD